MLPETSRDQNSKPSNRHRVIQRHPPAINHDDFAGDVAGRITGQKRHRIRNLRRLAESLRRRAANDFDLGFLAGQHCFRGDFGGDGAGRHGVHAQGR